MNFRKCLLPEWFKFLGVFLFFCGLLMGVVRFRFGIKPDILNLKMFAFYSSYLESKYLEIIRNNMGEEVVSILLVLGLVFMSFSREKIESHQVDNLRLKSFFVAVYLDVIFILTAILFTYGLAFVYMMMMINMVFLLVCYLISFRILLFNYRKSERKGICANDIETSIDSTK